MFGESGLGRDAFGEGWHVVEKFSHGWDRFLELLVYGRLGIERRLWRWLLKRVRTLSWLDLSRDRISFKVGDI